MARGKHSARSNVRRADAMAEHIDRLTDQLTEAKIKARRYEADAHALPAARVELARLRDQIASATSDELERERNRRQAQQQQHEAVLLDLAHLLRTAGQRVDSTTFYTHDEIDKMRRLLGPEAYTVWLDRDGVWTREARRRVQAARKPSIHLKEVEQSEHADYVSGGAA